MIRHKKMVRFDINQFDLDLVINLTLNRIYWKFASLEFDMQAAQTFISYYEHLLHNFGHDSQLDSVYV